MSKRIASWCAFFTLTTVSAWAQSSPGHVNYQANASGGYLDSYLTNSNYNQWILDHFSRLVEWSRFFDPQTTWYPHANVYIDSYALYQGKDPYTGQPTGNIDWGRYPALGVADPSQDWIIHDQFGNWLFIPFDCGVAEWPNTCPQYAADIPNSAFQTWWTSMAQTIVNRGYSGIFIDDVNLDISRVSYSDGNPAPPLDDNTGQPMTGAAWRSYFAQFTTAIRQAFPNLDLMENSIWYANTDQNSPDGGPRDADDSIRQQIKSATNINIERGVASDAGLTGGTGEWSVYALFNYIDRVHALGTSVTMQEYGDDGFGNPVDREYGLASYFMISNGSDRIGDGVTTPDNWFSGYSVELGGPRAERTYSNGVFKRLFSNGIVLLGEPGLQTQTVTLPPGTYTKLDGTQVSSSVTLSGRQGMILQGPTPYTINRYISDLTPQYAWQSWGTWQKDTSINGTPITLNTVQYSKGVGTHAYSELDYALWQNCTSFSATVGVDNEIPAGLPSPDGQIEFQVFGDNTKLYDSADRGTQFLIAWGPIGQVNVDLTGYQTLKLIVTNGITQAQAWQVPDDHADWANAIVGCNN